MGKKAVKVCVRTRPTANFAQDELHVDQDSNTIGVSPASHAEEDSVLNNKQSNFKFSFHHVLHNASQETVYESLARDVVQGCADGINGTVMSYGQTGSGKTFTMIGDTQNYQHRGIAPRALSHLFNEVGLRVETQFRLVVTYMELYNERIFDLLADISVGADAGRTSDFIIAEEKGGKGMHVRGLTEVEVQTEQEALNLLFSGELGRTTAQHKLNRRSNRSHCIFTIYIEQQSRSGVSEKVITSKLNLVDLAGSERLKKTMDEDKGQPIDDTLKKESMYINQSLTYLEQCVVAVGRKTAGHVPYRQSKLTNVLKDAIGGNCNTLMFACIWGESAHLEETVSTLRLASRMMRVQNMSSAVQVTDPVKMMKKQELQIKELKQELLMHDALADRSGVFYDAYTPEQRRELQRKIDDFVATQGDDDDHELLNFQSVRQMREICKAFKTMLKQKADENERLMTAASQAVATGLGSTSMGDAIGLSTQQVNAQSGEGLVGEVDGAGFALGNAPDLARPVTHEGHGPRADRGAEERMPLAGQAAEDVASASASMSSPMRGMESLKIAESKDSGSRYDMSDRTSAFAVFKGGAGKQTASELAGIKGRLRELKNRAKACAGSMNQSKQDIDDLNTQIDEKRRSRAATQRFAGAFDEMKGDVDDVVDEEEFRIMKRLREAKKQYRAAYEDLAGLRKDIEAETKEGDAVKYQLLGEFEEWYRMSGTETGFGDTFKDSGPQEDDVLDDQEKFERMETERIMSQDPESLAFFQAQKTRRANMTQNHVALRQIHKNKRNR